MLKRELKVTIIRWLSPLFWIASVIAAILITRDMAPRESAHDNESYEHKWSAFFGSFKTDNLTVTNNATITNNISVFTGTGLLNLHVIYNDWAPTGITSDNSVLSQAADDAGSLITGLDVSAINTACAALPSLCVGVTRRICNMNGHMDASTVGLANLDNRSLARDQFLVPGGGDHNTTPTLKINFKIGIDTCVSVIYAQPDTQAPTFFAWMVLGSPTRFASAVVGKLQLYPSIEPAPISGTVDNYDPIDVGQESGGYTCTSVSGSDTGSGSGSSNCYLDAGNGTMQTSTIVYLETATSATATITGLALKDGPHGDIGPVVVLYNLGPGNIVLADSVGSTTTNQFGFSPGGNAPVTMVPGRNAVMLYHKREVGQWEQLSKYDYLFDAQTMVATVGGQFSGTDTFQPLGSAWDVTLAAEHSAASVTVSGIFNHASLAARDLGTYNTTATGINVYGVFANLSSSRSGGGNPVNNTAIYATAAGGDSNIALETDGGDTIISNGGGNLDVRGPTYLRHNTSIGDALQTINGGIPTVNHGSLVTGSTNWMGSVTGVGSNSFSLTYSSAFATRSMCQITAGGSAAQIVTVVSTSGSGAVFDCFNPVTGALTNCNDGVTYNCLGE